MTDEIELPTETTPDPYCGSGGRYVIGEDGIRRPAPIEELQPALPDEEE